MGQIGKILKQRFWLFKTVKQCLKLRNLKSKKEEQNRACVFMVYIERPTETIMTSTLTVVKLLCTRRIEYID